MLMILLEVAFGGASRTDLWPVYDHQGLGKSFFSEVGRLNC